MTLPEGAKPIETNNSDQENGKNPEFLKVIADSKDTIAAHQVDIQQKRGRGRPAGVKNRPKLVDENHQPQAHEHQKQKVSVRAPNIAEFLVTPIKGLSHIPAVKYKIPELALNSEEAGACAEALNQVLQAFIPDIDKMDPKTAAVIGALATFGSIGYAKHQIYLEKTSEKNKQKAAEENNQPSEPEPARSLNGIDNARNHFARTNANLFS